MNSKFILKSNYLKTKKDYNWKFKLPQIKNMRSIKKTSITGILMTVTILMARAQTIAPPNQVAKINLNNQMLSLVYNDHFIFKGNLNINKDSIDIVRLVQKPNKAFTQVIKLTSLNDNPIHIEGNIVASDQSFSCEVDRRPDGLKIVRNSVGLSYSLLNRAVYDREEDWVLSVDNGCKIIITPQTITSDKHQFAIDITGEEIILRFRPRYYQFHLGLSYFKPWTYKVWKPSVAGWSSWFAFKDNINEDKIHRASDAIEKKLKPFGFNYIQIDDGYQQTPLGTVSHWLNANSKFPHGLDSLASYITKDGLCPGIWTNVAFQDKDFVYKHKDLFVTDQSGEPVSGRWVSYPMDGSNPKTIDGLIRQVYHHLKQIGWKYFKVDALRHLRYEGYNSHADYFKRKGIDRVEAFRNVVKAVRQEIGDSSFLLACWGVRPELIGLADACRIGTDGFYWAGLAQYNAFNNVVWRNDPDHIVLKSKYAYRDCMLTSMTGSLLMVTDKPDYYDTASLRAAMTSVPVLFTRPGQLYNVDPSRFINLSRVQTAVSGSGERVFDAGKSTTCDLFLTEFNKPYGHWMILARVGENEKYIPFNELGLDSGKQYLLFDFWNRSLKGIFTHGFYPGAIDTVYNCQLFCIREKKEHPQLLATNRHISCGALEINNMSWKAKTLIGESDLPANYQYILYLYEPHDADYSSFHCTGAVFSSTSKMGSIREIRMKTTSSEMVRWKVNYY